MARTPRNLLLATCFAVVGIVLAGFVPVSNHDTFGHLAAGRQIAEVGAVPELDTFSFFRDEPQRWNNYEWLSDLVFFALYDTLGFDGLLAFKLVLLALAVALLVRLAWRTSGDLGAILCAVFVVAAIPAVRFRLSERPHVIGIAFAALYLLALPKVGSNDTHARARFEAWGWTLALAAVHVVWVNAHGSNLLGLAMTGIFLASSARARTAATRLGILLALLLLVSFVSPYGPRILLDSIAHVVDSRYREIVLEWAPWDPNCPLWWLVAPIAQTLLLAAAAIPLVRRGRLGVAFLSVALLLAIMAFRSIRFMAEYLLLSAPVAAIGFSRWERTVRASRLRRVLAPTALASSAILAVVGSMTLVPLRPFGHGSSTRGLPAASATFLSRHVPDARILAPIEDAWYLMFAVPTARFLVDGRVPFYGVEHIQMIRRAFASRAALRETLDRFAVDTVVVRHIDIGHQPLLAAMRSFPSWRTVAIEDHHALFLRETPARSAVTSRFALRSLAPGYETEFVLRGDVDVGRVAEDAARLPRHPNTDRYRTWVEALLALRPLAVADGRAGLRPPSTAEERRSLATARRALSFVYRELEEVPTIGVMLAMAAIADCDLDAASAVLDRVEQSGGFRETLLLRQELALRRGRIDDVRAFIREVATVQAMAADPWLAELARRVETPPLCGP